MITHDELKQALAKVYGDENVQVEGSWRLMATVTAQAFAGKEEWQRQEAVWQVVRDAFDGDEVRIANVEFIFTYAPEG
jgi:acid stress-induced BolA-like protein IbaG/YrbA